MSDVPERLNAALEGRYLIERQLGEGGMATVYLADDFRHERLALLESSSQQRGGADHPARRAPCAVWPWQCSTSSGLLTH